MTEEEYEYIGQGRSNHIITAGLGVVVPITERARNMKSALMEIWNAAQKVFKIYALDDVEDLKKDLPWIITLSAFLNSDDRYIKEAEEIRGLINDLRDIDSDQMRLQNADKIELDHKRIIEILWRTGVIPRIINKCNNPQPYAKLIQESMGILSRIKGYWRAKSEAMFVLSFLSILQFIASKYIEGNIKKRIN